MWTKTLKLTATDYIELHETNTLTILVLLQERWTKGESEKDLSSLF